MARRQVGSLQAEARRRAEPIPSRLPAEARVFVVPKELVKILNRDLKLAGISKADDRGRTIDVHALRTTFGTLLSKGGVAPRTAQAAMRHCDIDLTMNVCTTRCRHPTAFTSPSVALSASCRSHTTTQADTSLRQPLPRSLVTVVLEGVQQVASPLLAGLVSADRSAGCSGRDGPVDSPRSRYRAA
jgi:hypothetical protein